MVTVELANVALTYHTVEGEVKALDGIDLTVKPQEFISIVGPSGCGKSTLLSLIAGLLKPTKGTIKLDDKLVQGTTQKVGYMLQEDYLFEWRTILGNAMLGLEVRNELNTESRKRVTKMLKDYGLGGFEHNYPNQLSGGMRQRVALIRTLAVQPDVLLLDEPFSALDYQNRLAVGEEVVNILKEQNKTVIMVTHDIPEAISMADRVIVMSRRPGRIVGQYDIPMRKEGLSPLQARESPLFRDYFSKIWKELNSNG